MGNGSFTVPYDQSLEIELAFLEEQRRSDTSDTSDSTYQSIIDFPFSPTIPHSPLPTLMHRRSESCTSIRNYDFAPTSASIILTSLGSPFSTGQVSFTSETSNAEINELICRHLDPLAPTDASHSVADSPPLARHTRMFKSRICNRYQKNLHCEKGDRCLYAHGTHELRPNPLYKSRICTAFAINGECRFGYWCHFAHSILDLKHS